MDRLMERETETETDSTKYSTCTETKKKRSHLLFQDVCPPQKLPETLGCVETPSTPTPSSCYTSRHDVMTHK